MGIKGRAIVAIDAIVTIEGIEGVEGWSLCGGGVEVWGMDLLKLNNMLIFVE